VHRNAAARGAVRCVVAPVKTRERALTKAATTEAARTLYDVCRGSIDVDDPFTLYLAWKLLAHRSDVEILKVSNLLLEASPYVDQMRANHSTDTQALKKVTQRLRRFVACEKHIALKLHVRVKGIAGVPGGAYTCEVQVCLSKLARVDRGVGHKLYEIERMRTMDELVQQPVFTKEGGGAGPTGSGTAVGPPVRQAPKKMLEGLDTE